MPALDLQTLPDKQARVSGALHRLASIVAARRGITLKELLDEIALSHPQIAAQAAAEKQFAAEGARS